MADCRMQIEMPCAGGRTSRKGRPPNYRASLRFKPKSELDKRIEDKCVETKEPQDEPNEPPREECGAGYSPRKEEDYAEASPRHKYEFEEQQRASSYPFPFRVV